jgi:hypothetical protein
MRQKLELHAHRINKPIVPIFTGLEELCNFRDNGQFETGRKVMPPIQFK